VIVVHRFRVPAADRPGFETTADPAVRLLASRTGLLSLDFGVNLDDPELWILATRWVDVGSYRRALSGYESRVTIYPLLALVIDEPSAYDDPHEVGSNRPRGS
jgi:hypothetical protein